MFLSFDPVSPPLLIYFKDIVINADKPMHRYIHRSIIYIDIGEIFNSKEIAKALWYFDSVNILVQRCIKPPICFSCNK